MRAGPHAISELSDRLYNFYKEKISKYMSKQEFGKCIGNKSETRQFSFLLVSWKWNQSCSGFFISSGLELTYLSKFFKSKKNVGQNPKLALWTDFRPLDFIFLQNRNLSFIIFMSKTNRECFQMQTYGFSVLPLKTYVNLQLPFFAWRKIPYSS